MVSRVGKISVGIIWREKKKQQEGAGGVDWHSPKSIHQEAGLGTPRGQWAP